LNTGEGFQSCQPQNTIHFLPPVKHLHLKQNRKEFSSLNTAHMHLDDLYQEEKKLGDSHTE
jgi:hypothetical protein